MQKHNIIKKGNIEFVGFLDGTLNGRVWIGDVKIADVFYRNKAATLFTEGDNWFDFEISFFEKHQPEGKWLESTEDYRFRASSIDEGLEWILFRLNKDNDKVQ